MKIALIGKGKMGNELINLANDQIVAVIENFKYNFLEDNLDIDVIIDFSNRENLKYIYDYAKRNKTKVVIATTNLNELDLKLIKDLANYTAVMLDSNYSKGINIIKKIINDNMYLLNNYDINIIEKHHKDKLDSPSGTAKSIENIFNNEKIKYNTISIRGGNINGEHEVLFLGDNEYIEIKHVSLSRKIYALGALEAARWIMCKEKGLFSYSDCIFY